MFYACQTNFYATVNCQLIKPFSQVRFDHRALVVMDARICYLGVKLAAVLLTGELPSGKIFFVVVIRGANASRRYLRLAGGSTYKIHTRAYRNNNSNKCVSKTHISPYAQLIPGGVVHGPLKGTKHICNQCFYTVNFWR